MTIYGRAAATELAAIRQLTLSSASFDKHSKQTRCAKFLTEMDPVVPWPELCAFVEAFYQKLAMAGHRAWRGCWGCTLCSNWFNLSDRAATSVAIRSRERAIGLTRPENGGRHHRRFHDHRGTEFDQE